MCSDTELRQAELKMLIAQKSLAQSMLKISKGEMHRYWVEKLNSLSGDTNVTRKTITASAV